MSRAGPVLVHAVARGLLVFAAAWLAFGTFPAYLAALCAAALVPYEVWCRARPRWGARCLAVAAAAPLSAALALGLPFHLAYAQALHAGGWGRARQALTEALSRFPADPPYSSLALTPWLEALPWHRPSWYFDSYTLLETSTLLAAVLTLVVFGSVFLTGASPQARERGWQALTTGVGGAVIGFAAWSSHSTPEPMSVVIRLLRPDPLWLWAYLILVGTACPLAAVMGDWLSGLPRARPAPAPHTAPPDAARAAS